VQPHSKRYWKARCFAIALLAGKSHTKKRKGIEK
jgi:hypothetical protein